MSVRGKCFPYPPAAYPESSIDTACNVKTLLMGRVLFKKGAYVSSGEPDQVRRCSSKEDGAVVDNNQLVTDRMYILEDMGD